jgi:cell division transport system permease protein
VNSAFQAVLIGFQATIANVRANMQTFLISIMTIAISIGILGIFLMIFFNLNGFLASWNQQVQLIVYLNDDISSAQKNNLEALFRDNSRVQSSEEVSKDRAWKDFRLSQTEKSGVDFDIGFNPLPSSYKVRFKLSDNRLAHISEFAEKIQSESGVETVEYGKNWISRFEKFMVFCRVFLMATGALLSFGLILIISNTIRLSIYSRQDEIELMLLIGATPGFVKIPFLLEGMLQGLCGSILSLGLMGIIYYYLKSEFQVSIESIARGMDFQFISQPFLLILVGLSVLIGLVASYISTYQYMQVLNKR